jgi:hypothetical protein
MPAKDCGSGAGSGQLEPWWERPADGHGDRSVDSGRGQLIGYEAARQVVAHGRRHGGGSVPVGLQRCADAVLEPAVDWRTELPSVVSNRCAAVAGRRDCTYARPSRRQMVPGSSCPA